MLTQQMLNLMTGKCLTVVKKDSNSGKPDDWDNKMDGELEYKEWKPRQMENYDYKEA